MLLIEVSQEIVFDRFKELMVGDEISAKFIPIYAGDKTLGIFPTP
jgi:hypothetical protein